MDLQMTQNFDVVQFQGVLQHSSNEPLTFETDGPAHPYRCPAKACPACNGTKVERLQYPGDRDGRKMLPVICRFCK